MRAAEGAGSLSCCGRTRQSTSATALESTSWLRRGASEGLIVWKPRLMSRHVGLLLQISSFRFKGDKLRNSARLRGAAQKYLQ